MELIWDGKQANFFTNGIEIRNFSDVYINRFAGSAAFETSGLSSIKAVDGSNLVVSDCAPAGKTPLVLKERVK
jgi:hypothetical protein